MNRPAPIPRSGNGALILVGAIVLAIFSPLIPFVPVDEVIIVVLGAIAAALSD